MQMALEEGAAASANASGGGATHVQHMCNTCATHVCACIWITAFKGLSG